MAPLRLLVLFAPLLLACSGTAPLAPKAAELNRLGIDALAAGDLATAEARFAVALEYHPRFVEALVNLGLTELARGNHERGKALFLRAKRINADLPHPHHGLGVLADKEKRPREAADHYREALRVDPGFVPARANLGRAYFAAGMLDDAREQFLRLSEVAPDDDRGPSGLAETLLRLGRTAEADEVVDRSLRKLGPRPSLLVLRARTELAVGETEGARVLLGRVVDSNGEQTTTALAWLAVVDLAEGKLEAAVAHAEAALGRDRLEPVATFALATALAAQGAPTAPAWNEQARKLARGGR
jgi:tetratricopeptide (TPR) repeat protein